MYVFTDPAKEDEKDAGKGGRRGVVAVMDCSDFIAFQQDQRCNLMAKGKKTMLAKGLYRTRDFVLRMMSVIAHMLLIILIRLRIRQDLL